MSIQLAWLAISKVRGRIGSPASRTRAPTIHADAARNRRGQEDRRVSAFEIRWSGRQPRNSKTNPAARSSARTGEEGVVRLTAAVEGDAVQLHAMVDEAEAELLGDPFLKLFEILIDEFDDVAGFDVDQM